MKLHKRGFTLIELLVVILIIGILTAIALPQYQKAVEKARAVQIITITKSLARAQQRYFLANGEYANDVHDLDITFPVNKTATSSFAILSTQTSCNFQNQSKNLYCTLNHPNITFFYTYDDGNRALLCCAYPEDNYKGDSLCQSLMNNTTWANGCGTNRVCHCYKKK